ncbi:MAG: DUF3794 domain-containing protein [Eubacteriales bacterium]|nr:DUF3794 domain-containing protein [Eubacteriales bacterium]
MNFCFDNKTVSGCREICRLYESVQTSVETVVPDTADDMRCVVSVQSRVLLKGKTLTSSGVCVAGEICAVCICITEKGEISHIKTSKEFEMNFETDAVSDEAQAQIFFTAPLAQGRLINPRKLSMVFETGGVLKVFGGCDTVVDSTLPKDLCCEGLHLKYDETEITAQTFTAEKPFVISEQFPFSGGSPTATELIWEQCDFHVNDVQMIGTKAIVRGSLSLTALYCTAESLYPVSREFSSPFSQIIDSGSEETEFSSAHIETTAVYADIQDTINGEKALNVEIHALIELTGCCRRKVRYVSDLYSNLVCSACVFEKRSNKSFMPVRTNTFVSNEVVKAPDDCEEIVSVISSLSQPQISGMTVSAIETLELIYRDIQGELCTARRSVEIGGSIDEENISILSSALTDRSVRTDGGRAQVHSVLELTYQSAASGEISVVAAAELDDETPFDFSALPTVTLVRAESEDLWEYAKTYHSDVAEIERLNELEGDIRGRLLLIPKTV